MSDSFRGLQRSFRADDIGERLLESFLDAVSARSKVADSLPGVSSNLAIKMVMLRSMMQFAIGDQALLANRDTLGEYLEYPVQEFLNGIEAWGKVHTAYSNAGQQVANRSMDLMTWARQEANLDSAAKLQLQIALSRVVKEYRDLDAFYDKMLHNAARLQELLPQFAKAMVSVGSGRDFLNGMLSLVNEMEPLVRISFSPFTVNSLRREIGEYRQVAAAFESIVYR